MNSKRYQEVSQSLLDEAKRIEDSKRPAYTVGNEDSLHNFKTVASRLGITPRQALMTYAQKHFDSIAAWAKDPNIPQAEEMIGRFADAINYLKLGYALLVEEEESKQGNIKENLNEVSKSKIPFLTFVGYPQNGFIGRDLQIEMLYNNVKEYISNWDHFVDASYEYFISLIRYKEHDRYVYDCTITIPKYPGTFIEIKQQKSDIVALLSALNKLQCKSDYRFFAASDCHAPSVSKCACS